MLGFLGDQKKKKVKPLAEVNPIEAIRDFGGSFSDSVKQDLLKGSVDETKKQIAEVEEKTQQLHGDLTEGQELNLSAHSEEAPKRHDIDPGLDYHREIRHVSERSLNMENRQIDATLEQVMVELEKLIEESSDLEQKFEIMAVEQRPVEPGSYHLNFFEWIISTIQTAREQIEDSNAWLSAIQSKKGKKSYWAMAKKHGTSFSMSNERQVATQSG